MNQTDIDKRRNRIELLIKTIGLCVAAFLVAPFVLIVIKGLIGLVVAAAIGGGIIFFTPVVARVVANWRLKALKAEAARNPIETLQNDYGKRQQGLRNFASRISDFATAVGSFEDKLGEFKRAHPEDAPKFDEQLRKMKLVLENRKTKFKEAQSELVAYDKEIHRASDIWEMGQAAAAMTSAAGMTEDDFLQKISTETALDSVQKSMNRAFADLEVSLLEEQKPAQQLTAGAPGAPSATIVDVESTPVRAKREN
jgi:hypothetical protein